MRFYAWSLTAGEHNGQSLMAITREDEEWKFEKSKRLLQDVQTHIPKDPEIARSAESLCPSTMLWPQTAPPWGAHLISLSYDGLLLLGQVQLWPLLRLRCTESWWPWWTEAGFGCRCECRKLYPAPPTMLVFKLRPHFSHCSPFVAIQKALFSANPRSTGQGVWSTPCPAATMTNYCSLSSPFVTSGFALLIPPVPIISALWMWRCLLLWHWAEFRKISSIYQLFRNSQKDLQTGSKNPGLNENIAKRMLFLFIQCLGKSSHTHPSLQLHEK